MVNNHGHRKSPKDQVFVPSKWPKWLINGGDPNHLLVEMILQVSHCGSMGLLFVLPGSLTAKTPNWEETSCPKRKGSSSNHQLSHEKKPSYPGWLIGWFIIIPIQLGSIIPSIIAYITQPSRVFFIAQFSGAIFLFQGGYVPTWMLVFNGKRMT